MTPAVEQQTDYSTVGTAEVGTRPVPSGSLLDERLSEMDTESAQTWLGVLDYLAELLTAEHVEMASQLGCAPDQLRARNGKMTQLLRAEFTGYGWPFGWRYGRADEGESNDATIYEMHPQVA